jgi:hypothetical protein
MPIPPPVPLKAGLFGRSTGPRTIKPTPTGAPPSRGPSGVKIEHRVGIQASAEVVWSVIADIAGWPGWNPIYPEAAGNIRIGAVLDLTLALPGQPPEDIQPTVLDWVPLEQLHLKLKQMGGLVRTVRYIEIESMAAASCIISNGEIVGGLLGKTRTRSKGRAIYRGFVAMNEALKLEAEARYARRD